MTTVTVTGDGTAIRPSRLIAEALVHRHSRDEVENRAQELGLPSDLVETVVSVCCEQPAAQSGPLSSPLPHRSTGS